MIHVACTSLSRGEEGGAEVAEVTCSRCGARCDAGEPRCPSCGGYLGARPPRPRLNAPAEEARRGPFFWFLDLFPGLVRPRVLIMSLVALPVAAGLVGLGLALFSIGGVFAGMAVAAFGMVTYWAAVAWLIYGYVCLPGEALSEFDGTRWMVFALLASAPMVALFAWLAAKG